MRHKLQNFGFIIGLATLLMTGCASLQLGHDFDLQAFTTQVEVAKTSQADIRSWLGEPVSTGFSVHDDGQRAAKWTYYYASGKLPKLANARLKILEIQFDAQLKVESYNWSE